MKNTLIAAFSKDGTSLALRIAEQLGGRVFAPQKYVQSGVCAMGCPLSEWTGAHFAEADAIIFVSACGIAVRAIAPYVRDKTTDPAIVVLDDAGRNVIPLLSGHIGGANSLAVRVASITGGTPIVTTATDVHGLVAVDEWAVNNNCVIENIKAAKDVSAAVLAGQQVGVAVTEENIPTPWPVTLFLRPRNLVLGVGCKRGTDFGLLLESALNFLNESGLSPLSVSAVASIDLKIDEDAIVRLAEHLGVPFRTYSAEELRALEGCFTASAKVESVTGVDNVCERAAVLCSQGTLMRGKTIYKGITLSLAKAGWEEATKKDKRQAGR